MPRFSRRNSVDQAARNFPGPQPDQMATDQMDTAARVLALAKQTADQAVSDAKREAERIIGEARQEADRIIADANSRSQGRAQDVF